MAGAGPGKKKIKIKEREVGVVNWKLETKLALKDVGGRGGIKRLSGFVFLPIFPKYAS